MNLKHFGGFDMKKTFFLAVILSFVGWINCLGLVSAQVGQVSKNAQNTNQSNNELPQAWIQMKGNRKDAEDDKFSIARISEIERKGNIFVDCYVRIEPNAAFKYGMSTAENGFLAGFNSFVTRYIFISSMDACTEVITYFVNNEGNVIIKQPYRGKWYSANDNYKSRFIAKWLRENYKIGSTSRKKI